jgi:hypothetical protein
MVAQQAALAAALPRFFQKLVNGEGDGSGAPEFHPARDLHVGVVSSSLALDAADPLPDCALPGLDGVLQHGTCAPTAQDITMLARAFDTLEPDGDSSILGTHAACRVLLEQGCRFPQPLEAALRALAPPPEGHAQDFNAGFMRDDALLVVIVLADSDDCSIAAPDQLGAPPIATKDGLVGANVDTLCVGNPDELQPVGRYIVGLAGLHTSVPDGVMVFAIAGLPPELASAEVLSRTMLEDDGSRDAFYRAILDSPAMRQTIDMKGTLDLSDDEITPVCNTERGLVRPSRRIIELARSFGVNGLVQSICESNLARPLDAILRSIGHRLGPVGI